MTAGHTPASLPPREVWPDHIWQAATFPITGPGSRTIEAQLRRIGVNRPPAVGEPLFRRTLLATAVCGRDTAKGSPCKLALPCPFHKETDVTASACLRGLQTPHRASHALPVRGVLAPVADAHPTPSLQDGQSRP